MRFILILFIGSISFLSYGQENSIQTIHIEWEQLSAPLVLHKKENNTITYQLLEVNLDIDLRQEALRDDSSMMMITSSKKQNDTSRYNIVVSKPKTSSFTIQSNGYNPNINTNGIKNTAYKDASSYSNSFFCPATRRPIYY
ncbi:hypothetical protein [Aquimarina longa]|uniref:hypothetical protein n=1 Tax=Aquimarina longa TaxID=1080221 RepID=UPI000784816E|nr:hypothetical protein [Aquimarina longa]